jgi:Nuclease-related domain
VARFFPERPPEDTPDSEIAVFHALAGLDERFTVFHSVGWHRGDGKPDGEADFLVAHPVLGLLVLEVKGGGIDFDAGSGRWTSRDRKGNVNPIHDPFDQALAAKHAIVRELVGDPRWPPRRRVQIGYAVVFPSMVITASGFTYRGKREITFGKNDLDRLPAAIVDCLRYWQQADAAPQPGPEGVSALVERYGKSWSYAIPFKEAYAPEERRIVDLTEQQMEILYHLERHNRAAIAGCAGSGKTLLAVAKARELAGQGKSVLLTCFNKALAEHWSATLDLPQGVVAKHFHGFCSEVVRQAGLRAPRPNLSPSEFSAWLPTGLYEALGVTPLRFDAVIVDEAQDFESEWFEYLDLLLADEASGVYFAFYDDNQRLYQTDRIPRWFGPTYVLSKNVRNTNEIGSVVQRFYTGTMRLSGVTGPEVRVEPAGSGGANPPTHITVLGRVLRDLRSGGADPVEIVVLTPKRASALAGHRSLGGWRLRARDQRDGDVLWETIHSFKGQDRSIVILTELDDLSDLSDRPDQWVETLLYVGCSRARVLLIVIAPSSLAEALADRA